MIRIRVTEASGDRVLLLPESSILTRDSIVAYMDWLDTTFVSWRVQTPSGSQEVTRRWKQAAFYRRLTRAWNDGRTVSFNGHLYSQSAFTDLLAAMAQSHATVRIVKDDTDGVVLGYAA